MILCACMTNSTSGREGGGEGFPSNTLLKNTIQKSTRPWSKPTEYHVVLDYGRVDIRSMLFEMRAIGILFSTSVPTHKCLT